MRLDLAQDLVRARCYGACEGCGAYGAVQVHHRQARGMGGVSRAAAELASDVRNLLALCPSCHERTERAETWAETESLGWRVPHWADPFETPALLYTVNGHGWWYLYETGYRRADLDVNYRITWRSDDATAQDPHSPGGLGQR